MQWVQLLLLVLKLASWISTQISQEQWKVVGYNQAVADQLAALTKSLALADKAVEEANVASDAELHKDLAE